ncbi:hypothetical protein AB0K74_45495 [Streptomyces sp. NPDC056159]|uniref:hypothetical protein n=1 Tax=Streptomyces sp. NPDC056159 TaxID=3155537 RepID=UPI003424B240
MRIQEALGPLFEDEAFADKEQVEAHQASGDPVISVDPKKKAVRHDAARDE